MAQSEVTSESFRTVRRDIISVVGGRPRAIAEQMSQQEADDNQLITVLEELTRFYSELHRT